MKRQHKIIVFNAGGSRAKILPGDFNDKIKDFIKSLTGNDFGAFLIYQEGFLIPKVEDKIKELKTLDA